jgi:hypothetical protein
MKRVITLAAFLWLVCGIGRADRWTVSYEGNDMPESEPGWYRAYAYGGAIRSIETDPADPNNYFLVINSLANQMIYDYAYCPHQMDPNGPREKWWAEWRVLIAEAHGDVDQAVAFASDHDNQVGFDYYYDRIYNGFDGWSIHFAPGIFHTYRLESSDVVTYNLWIDGQLARHAPWFEGVSHSYAAFGDCVQGGGSRSVGMWDYFRFGVSDGFEPGGMTWDSWHSGIALAPEPGACLLVMVCACAHGGRRASSVGPLWPTLSASEHTGGDGRCQPGPEVNTGSSGAASWRANP